MSQFPAIKPSSRGFTPGMLPVNSIVSVSGKETRVIMGDTMHGHAFSLNFQNLQEAAAKQIIDHWYGQQGTALSFSLPGQVWAGWAEYRAAITDGQNWRYASQPKVSAVSPGIMNLSVELISLA